MLIVQKYGGATVSDPQKIKSVAARLASLHRAGHQVVAVVSAMGKTTNQLIDLAHQISDQPNRRELDMLLTTGERVTMALVTMALHDLKVPAISFTGSQAGILTDDSHFNAQIQDVKPFRVEEALKAGKVVVLAGFQGVSPSTKEITTLGRGGSDSTAIAMAAALKADRCEILKDVPAVFSADPNIVTSAHVIPELTYEQMLDMTLGGAKVLYYRGVEIAKKHQVPIYVGPASDNSDKDHLGKDGTWIGDEIKRKVETQILGINSHATVLEISTGTKNLEQAKKELFDILEKNEIAPPQILFSNQEKNGLNLFITGPIEILQPMEKVLSKNRDFQLNNNELSSVTVTFSQLLTSDLCAQVHSKLKSVQIQLLHENHSNVGMTLILKSSDRELVLHLLHSMT